MIQTFRDWLFGDEVVALLEGFDPQDAARRQSNAAISQAMGHEDDWYGIIARQASKFRPDLDLVHDTAQDIIRRVTRQDPGDRFWACVQGIKDRNESDAAVQLVRCFQTHAYLRARRFAERPRQPVQMASNYDAADRRASPADEATLEELKDAVAAELKAMASEERGATKSRLELAQRVLPVRLENAPRVTGLAGLMAAFPGVKKNMMFRVIRDIEEAFRRVAGRRAA